MKNFLNCHTVGLHSFPVSFENGLYKRIFYAEENHYLWKPIELAIHPHHVDIKITVLDGKLFNPIYEIHNDGDVFNKFQWESHILNGKVFDISKYVTINDRGEVEFDKYYTLHEVLRHFLLSEGITKERLNPVAEYSLFERNSTGLYICAPEDQFDTTNLVDVNGLLKLGRPILVEKDPIVFRYVRGGVQIITKWGLEAADEALANEKLN